MHYLTDLLYGDSMPAKAKILYQKTFNRYHKLNGGDEQVALHLARRALEKNYVKINDCWLPKEAAEAIVRHDMYDDDDDDINDDNDNDDDDDAKSNGNNIYNKNYKSLKPNYNIDKNNIRSVRFNNKQFSNRTLLGKRNKNNLKFMMNDNENDNDGGDDDDDDDSVNENVNYESSESSDGSNADEETGIVLNKRRNKNKRTRTLHD
ncbi:chaB-1 domain protein [Lambdina fiscellaria nucleopolyhedrovirus]|uniref:ChaB-1 domain protein n=1 Tax=Lambdina fiscellaria nucleopolyhedrovirus TaxID=1642929 RepID=A0A0E3Z6T1_9ABAC|nr:chaB-1 domain protein [Lambdina fiscellaria nucleopolyhedrovirus]AKC91713.1 chaB-1 domain protein [Lambdina fiscellaria nucleopolyhedrovirus]